MKLRALVVFLMLNLFGFTSIAQLSSSVITPSNMFTVAEDVVYYYNYYIDVADNDVRTFIYSSQISGIYEESVEPPYGFFSHMDEYTAIIEWGNIPAGYDLRIRSFNMRTGDREEYLPEPTINRMILPHHFLDRYVYLLTYINKERNSVVKSADYIIIEENPVIRELPALACDCLEPGLILERTNFSDVEQNLNNIVIEDNVMIEDRMYKVEFQTQEASGFYHIVKRGGKSPFRYDVSSSEGCIENVKTPENEFLFYGLSSPEGDGSILGFSMGYETGLRMHWLDQSVDGTIKITDCGASLGELRSAPAQNASLNSLRHFPNPTDGYSTLQYELEQAGPINLWITDARGQIVSILEEETPKVAGNYSIELNLSELPNGLYTAHLQIAGQRQTLRLLKVN